MFSRQDSTPFPSNNDSPTLAAAPTLSSGGNQISSHREYDNKTDEKLPDNRSYDQNERSTELPADPSALDTADLDPANRTDAGEERPIEVSSISCW
jgi:hypothetical protein